MALLSLLFNKPKKVTISSASQAAGQSTGFTERELIIIDAATSVSHTMDSEPTEFPIESGGTISDHVEIKPRTITLSGVISEAPLSLEAAAIGNVAGIVGGLAGNALGARAGAVGAGALAVLGGKLLNDPGNRVKDAFNSMIEIRNKKILLTIVTGLDVYNNMIMTSFNPTETVDNGDSLIFSATFREIRIVSSREVTLPERAVTGPGHSASPTENLGKQPATEAEVSAKSETILNKLIF